MINKSDVVINEDDDLFNEFITSASPFYNATTTASLNYLNYKTLFLATKLSYFVLNEKRINELINSLLTLNPLLNNEIQLLFDNSVRLHKIVDYSEPDRLLEICLEHLVDYEFIINVLWNRIHHEPLVMKFISLRYSNYSTYNIRNNLSQPYDPQQGEHFDWQTYQILPFGF